jgi:hypothetical protein
VVSKPCRVGRMLLHELQAVGAGLAGHVRWSTFRSSRASRREPASACRPCARPAGRSRSSPGMTPCSELAERLSCRPVWLCLPGFNELPAALAFRAQSASQPL